MNIQSINTGIFDVNSLIIPCSQDCCLVVDPAACSFSGDENKITDYLKKMNLKCAGILLTHSHFDHIMGINIIKNAFPDAPVALHINERQELECPPGPMNVSVVNGFGRGAAQVLDVVAKQPKADILLNDNDNLKIINPLFDGWKVIHTPGHTPGSVCFYNADEKVLVAGDTLFYGSWGRTDMYGGNDAQMEKSLALLKKLIPGDVTVYSGHGETGWLMSEGF